MQCPRCGMESDDKAKFCRTCGITLIPGMTLPKPQGGPGKARPKAITASSPPEFTFSSDPQPSQTGSSIPPAIGTRDSFDLPDLGTISYAQEYAGFWRRFAASFLDGLVLSVVAFVFSFTISMLAAKSQGSSFIMMLLMFGVIVLYFPVMESSERQGTYGKSIMGIYVTDLNGERITFWRAVARVLVKNFLSGIMLVGYIIQPFTAKKQALHDIIAGTVVIKR